MRKRAKGMRLYNGANREKKIRLEHIGGSLSNQPILILYYNTMWKSSEPPDTVAPPGFEITTDRGRLREADAVIFHIPQWKWQPRFLFPPKRTGQLWIAWSMECEENYPRLKNPNFMRAFDLTMTYRLDSDVPVTYLGYYSSPANLVRAMRQPPAPKTTDAPAVMLISSRVDRSGRRAYTRELMRHMPVDSFGTFLRNRKMKTDLGHPSKMELIERYKFTLAFENAIGRDYVTEKFFDPLVRGSVPVYLGAPNIEDFAPGEHCFINVRDFPDPRALAEYLQYLSNNETEYSKLLEWKEKPLRRPFMNLVETYMSRLTVPLCQAIERRLQAR